MALFGRKKLPGLRLDREDALSARPVLSRLVKVERGEDGNIVLQVPRRDTATVRAMSRLFGMPPYRQVALDELGTFVIELCDGKHTVRDLARRLAGRFRLDRREAEVSVTSYLRDLGRRSIVGLLVDVEGDGPR